QVLICGNQRAGIHSLSLSAPNKRENDASLRPAAKVRSRSSWCGVVVDQLRHILALQEKGIPIISRVLASSEPSHSPRLAILGTLPMKIATIVQARMGSTRLPGKVLLDLGGMTVLARVVNRLRRAKLVGEIIIATTNDPADAAIVEECSRLSVWG